MPTHETMVRAALAEVGWREGVDFWFIPGSTRMKVADTGPESHRIIYRAALMAGSAIDPNGECLCLKHSLRGLQGACKGATKRQTLLDLMAGVEWCGQQRWK